MGLTFCFGKSMTPSRVPLALVLVMAAVLLAAGCSAPQVCPPQTNTTPWILINPIGDHVAGDELVISGITNLPPGTGLDIWVHELYHTCPLGGHCEFFEKTGYLSVSPGTCGVNTWSFATNLSGYKTRCSGYCPGIFVDVGTQHLWAGNETRSAKNDTSFHVTVPPELPPHIMMGQEISFSGTVPVCNPYNYLSDTLCRNPIREARVWLFGKNIVNITSVPVDPDGSYTVTLDPATTGSLGRGTYTLIVQYPLNKSFEIGPEPGSGRVYNKNGDVLFDTTWVENGAISGNAALSDLKYELGKKGVTDRWKAVTVDITGPEELPDKQPF
jgi:hypothetical protein